jgi:hypothetical protein
VGGPGEGGGSGGAGPGPLGDVGIGFWRGDDPARGEDACLPRELPTSRNSAGRSFCGRPRPRRRRCTAPARRSLTRCPPPETNCRLTGRSAALAGPCVTLSAGSPGTLSITLGRLRTALLEGLPGWSFLSSGRFNQNGLSQFAAAQLETACTPAGPWPLAGDGCHPALLTPHAERQSRRTPAIVTKDRPWGSAGHWAYPAGRPLVSPSRRSAR